MFPSFDYAPPVCLARATPLRPSTRLEVVPEGRCCDSAFRSQADQDS